MDNDQNLAGIAMSKFQADGARYFGLFDPHIPTELTGNVLLLSLSNPDCVAKTVAKNPGASYTVVDDVWTLDCLRALPPSEKMDFIKDLDVYNIIKGLDMKFDCVIMNPPYKAGLHIKILNEAIKHLKADGRVISLQPIVKWQEAILFNTQFPIDNTCILKRYTMNEASELFNSHQRCDLGIISNGKANNCQLVDNIGTLQKIKNKLDYAITIGGLLKDKLEDDYKMFPVNFTYNCTIAGNGGHGKACYRFTGTDEVKATRREKIGHCARYNAKDKMEQHLVYSFYTNQLIRFIAKEFGFGGIPYKIIPFVTGFIDDNGKTPLDEEWTFEKLVKWFELDYNDLVVIRKSLDTYLHPEEQKVIEDTMKKYAAK